MKKKPDFKSTEATVNKIMETIHKNENNTNSKEPIQKPTNEEDLMNLLNNTLTQYNHTTHTALTRSRWYHSNQWNLHKRNECNLLCYSPRTTNNSTAGYRGKYVCPFTKNFKSLLQKPKLKSHTFTVMSVSRANLGPIGQYNPTLNLGNKCCTHSQWYVENFNFRTQLAIQLQIGYNWNVNGHLYITFNNNYLCSSMPSTDT